MERRQKRQVETALVEDEQLDEKARRDLVIQQILEQAFSIRNDDLKNYLLDALHSHKQINTSELPVHNAEDLLAMAHAIEMGAVNQQGSDYTFQIEPTGKVGQNNYFDHFDDFSISLKKNTQENRIDND